MGMYVRSGVVEVVESEMPGVPGWSVELGLTRIPSATVSGHGRSCRHEVTNAIRGLCPMKYVARL